MSGGDIQNAVWKAALSAAAEPIPDVEKKIHQHHFETGIEQVVASKRVMQQSIFGTQALAQPEPVNTHSATAADRASQLLLYGLPGAAVLIALVALCVALLK